MTNRFIRLLATSGLVLAGLAFHQSSAQAAFAVLGSPGASAASGATYANLDLTPTGIDSSVVTQKRTDGCLQRHRRHRHRQSAQHLRRAHRAGSEQHLL